MKTGPKFEFDGIGFTGRKRNAADAEKAEARLKRIEADIKSLSFDTGLAMVALKKSDLMAQFGMLFAGM